MSTLSAVIKVFGIPELSEMIHTRSTPHDFAQCILVCKAFAQVFTPILWHTISLRQDDQHAWFTTSSDVQAALIKNAHLVQVIQVRTCKSLGPFLELVERQGGGGDVMLPRLHTLQFPCYYKSLSRYAVDDLRPSPDFAGKAVTGTTTTVTSTPTRDWLRYNGMFLMRRYYFIDRLYRQRQMHEFHQRQIARQQLDEFWKHTKDPNYVATKLKEGEERMAQLEQECLVQEKKFPYIGKGLGPALVEQDLVLLRDKIRQTKEEMDLLRVKASDAATGLSVSGTNDSNHNSTGSPSAEYHSLAPFCVDYEEGDEEILEQFLDRFPQIQTLMSTSVPFLSKGVFRKIVGLEGLRSLSLTVFHASLLKQVSNIHTLLTTCPPNLEILRLSFMKKNDGTFDMFARNRSNIGNNNSNSTTTTTVEQVSAKTTINTNTKAKEEENEMSLDLVQLSIKRSGPLRSLRRLFIEGSLGDPAALIENNNTTHPFADSQTWVAFLERCPNLLTLSLGDCAARVLPELGHALKVYCALIEDFAIGYKSFLSTPSYGLIDPNLAILLSSLSGLKRLRIDALSLETGSQILGVIQHRFASTLTDISFNDCKYVRLRFLEESHSIFSLLQSLRKVESLDLIPSGEIFHTNEHSLGASRFVSEVFSRPWQCQGTLRVLRINIDAIMRKVPTYSSTKEQDMENSRQLQQWVCQFLGSFPLLEELTLGVMTSSPWEKREAGGVTGTSALDHEQGPVYGAFKFSGLQATCLALSLTHGLELMGGLKRLRVFNVARLEHMIESEEIEFMMDQWPRLEFLPGLLRAPWFQGESGRPVLEREERMRQVVERDREIVEWMKERCPYLRVKVHKDYNKSKRAPFLFPNVQFLSTASMDLPTAESPPPAAVSAASRFFSITELILAVAAFLERGAIAQFSQVNHNMNSICTPLLYANQDFFMATSVNTIRILDSLESMSAFARNIHNVQTVITGPLFATFYYHCLRLAHREQGTQRPLLEGVVGASSLVADSEPRTKTMIPVGPMTNLTTFTYHAYYSTRYLKHHAFVRSTQYPRIRHAQLFWTLQQLPHLTNLTMDMLVNDEQDILLLVKAIPELRALKKLDITVTRDSSEDWSQMIPAIVFNLPASIECFGLEDVDDFDYDQIERFWPDQSEEEDFATDAIELANSKRRKKKRLRDAWSSQDQPPLEHLRQLHIASFAQVSFDDISAILGRCSALVELHIPDLDDDANLVNRVARCISESCPQITQLYQHGRERDDRGLTLAIINVLQKQRLELLRFSGLHGSGDLLAATLTRHSTVLRDLQLTDSVRLSSKSIQKILSTGQVLEVFRIEPYRHEHACLTLEDAVAVEWVCKGIKQLRLVLLTGAMIPPAEDVYYKRPAPIILTKEELERFSKLEALYRRIGSLVELEHLHLNTVAVYNNQENRYRYSSHDVDQGI
ncbi:hypothetical protein BGZ95_003319 [Linnemannia exigua]|uniref:F-box domain-containing protein n=1 Tax=Linnemannia exigua TaxID=604196 RepID=A0AAD4D4Q2_9FUNG|nr:hypothetical protein BGZ95_003319 [Linnemannia exigua]